MIENIKPASEYREQVLESFTHDHMISECMDHEDLTAWEYDFINSLSDQIETKILTKEQASVLTKIHERVTA